jgi:hypothetical protein
MVGAEILYVTAVNMYKISLLCLYFRLFPVTSIRKGGYILGGLSTAWNLASILAAAFQCTPREKIWEPWLEGVCIDLFLTQLCIAVPSILCDIGILCLPLPHVWRLKTNLTQRILLTAIFMLGSYVVFTSIYRFYIFLHYRREDATCNDAWVQSESPKLRNANFFVSRYHRGRPLLERYRDQQWYSLGLPPHARSPDPIRCVHGVQLFEGR